MAKPKKTPPTAPYEYTETRTKISDVEIARAAYGAGFRGESLRIAIATAIGESHGNTTAIADRGEFSVGLWQINVNGYLVKRLKQFGLTRWTDLYDPNNNAKAAYIISGGGKRFKLWSIFKHGAHLKFMDRADLAADVVEGNAPSTPAPGGTTNQPNSKAPKREYLNNPVFNPNILPSAQISVGPDPALIILIIGVLGVILVGVLLRNRNV